MSWQIVGLVALFITTINLVMSFARTGPEEAFKNIAKWIEWLRAKNIPKLLAAIIHSPYWRFANGVFAAVSLLGLIYSVQPWNYMAGSTQSPQAPPIVQSPASQPAVQTAKAPDAALTPRSLPNLSDEDIATKLSIWESVAHSNHSNLVNAYNKLDLAVSQWTRRIGTAGDRKKLHDEIMDGLSVYMEASSALETLRSQYHNYQDIEAVLYQPRRAALDKAVKDFTYRVLREPDVVPSDLEVQLRPLAGALRREMNATVKWFGDVQREAENQRAELAGLK